MPGQFPPEKDAAIAADYAAGMKRADICAKHRISATGMHAAIARQKVPSRSVGKPPTVADDTLDAIAEDRRSGDTYQALGERYGVTANIVTKAVNRAILVDDAAGMSIRQIKKRYRVGHKRIQSVRRAAKRPDKESTAHGGKWPSEDEFREMIRRDAMQAIAVNGFGASPLAEVV